MAAMSEPVTATHAKPDAAVPSTSRLRRGLWTGLGCVFMTLGVIGVVLPVLPTTPFMLVAAACFTRGSRRLHAWLLGSRLFGSTIRAWQETHTIPLRAKITAISLIVISLGVTIVFAVSNPVLRIVLAATGLAVIAYLLRVPTRRAPVETGHDADSQSG